ncbi:tetratricopeptide repeat protein [Chitinophagaceae bacterium MMS25-I14]
MAAQKKNTGNKQAAPVVVAAAPAKEFSIPRPLLWLSVVVILLYISCIQFGFTELDDSIFIRDLHAYNEHFSNFGHSFARGVFDEAKDTYYRPLFLNSILLNYQVSGQEPGGYHFVNILLHLGAVLLLYGLFIRLQVKQWQAFLLALLFAVHPVLTQAVAWIPGRNDTQLAVFIFGFFICSIKYTDEGKLSWLLLSLLLLLGAFFTKETAVFAAPVAFVLLVLWLGKSVTDKRMLVQYGVWVAAFLFWFGVRAAASIQHASLQPGQMVHEFGSRLPLIVQYLGKIVLPFNLSVFPVIDDTVYYYGIAALIILTAAAVLAKGKMNRVLAAIAVFLLFLLPVLIVPRSLNEQTFEHRLYLPIIGILLLLTETIFLKNKVKAQQVFYAFLVVATLFTAINYRQQQFFKDPLSFWTEAARTSPHSAYAVMMLGARTEDKNEANALMRRAYGLNPNEKYLNYYYGVMLQNEDSVLQSEPYLLKEKKISDYYQCDFYLARVAITKNQPDSATQYLERYLTRDIDNPQANNNLLLLYMNTGKKAKAVQLAAHMQMVGQTVPLEVQNRINSMN